MQTRTSWLSASSRRAKWMSFVATRGRPSLRAIATSSGIDGFLLGQAVVHELDVIVAGGEQGGVFPGRLFGLLREAPGEPDRELALEAGRHADEAAGVGGQQLFVDPRPVVEALEVALGDELAEVAVAGLVLDQEDEVVVVDVARTAGLLVEPALRRDVDLAAEDGLDALGLGLFEELDGAENVAVVGHGHGGHLLLVGLADEVRHTQTAVEDAVFGMVVQMDERRFHGRLSLSKPGGPPRRAARTVYPIPTRSSRAAWSSRRRRPG